MDLNITNNQKPVSEDGLYCTPYNVDLDQLDSLGFKNYIGRITELPQEFQSIISDFSTAEFIEDVLGQNFALNTEQKKAIARIIRDVILVDVYLGDFVQLISQRVSVDPQKAKDIANAILAGPLSTQLDTLKKMHIAKFGQKQTVTVPALAQPPALSQPQKDTSPQQSPNDSILNLKS